MYIYIYIIVLHRRYIPAMREASTNQKAGEREVETAGGEACQSWTSAQISKVMA